MKWNDFVGPAYRLRNIQADCQQCINWYVEVIESGKGKNDSKMQLVPTQGLATVVEGTAGRGRGGYVASNGTPYWVSGNKLYTVNVGTGTSGWSLTERGTITNGNTPVQFADNGVDLFLVSSTSAYKCDLATNVVTAVVGAGSVGSVTYMDTYIVFSRTDSNQFVWTDPLTNSVPALNFASAEANPDQIVGLINHNQDLWLFGRKTTELWYNYGQGNTVFAQREGLLIETGCVSAATIKKIDNTLAWLGIDDRGGPMLMVANGYSPQRMSLHPIEQKWEESTSAQWEQAWADVYQEGGHHFYVLNIPGQDSTWVFDLTSTRLLGQPVWHERVSNDGNGNYFRNIASGHLFAGGYHITGGYNDQNLYIYDKDTWTDDGNPIIRERVTPHVSQEMKQIFYDRLQVDFLTGATTNLTLDPQVMLQFSDDGGFTWSNEIWVTSGMTGKYRTLVEWRRLGSSRDRVYRVRCSDGQYWAISGASMDVRMGSH